MEKIYAVTKTTRGGRVTLHAFSSVEKAETFCINYLYNNSTLEDRTYNRIEKSEYTGFTEYSLYTAEHGSIDLGISEVLFD